MSVVILTILSTGLPPDAMPSGCQLPGMPPPSQPSSEEVEGPRSTKRNRVNVFNSLVRLQASKHFRPRSASFPAARPLRLWPAASPPLIVLSPAEHPNLALSSRVEMGLREPSQGKDIQTRPLAHDPLFFGSDTNTHAGHSKDTDTVFGNSAESLPTTGVGGKTRARL